MKSIMTNIFDHKRKLSPVHVGQVADPISGSVRSPKRLKKETTPINDCSKTNTLSKEKEYFVSLLDSFGAEEIEVHLKSLCKPMNTDDECCQLCGINELEFKIPPLYCSLCGELFKMSYSWKSTVDKNGVPYNFCKSCLKKTRNSETISLGKHSFSKESLQEGVKYIKQEESWVLCDKCEKWQHQICGLFNPERDKDKEAKYICPKCRLNELRTPEDEYVSSIITPALGSKHLPKTKLSDHIENRLHESLALERNQRAKALGKSPREVPEAKDLVVRVVLSVKNKLKVKKEYLDIVPGKSYPEELPYTSKLILLFQKVDGVEVCILAMYVQEFGSECAKPNQWTVYISYLDSVKYFTPEVRTVSGDSLRTFVYQEILIGYLDYCKKRGFNTCYIWSCPPKKGDDDYILNCHPTVQHTPKPHHLRKWYQAMLKKAKEQDVIEGYTNFCNKFMEAKNNKITAARLPYFDGSYWSEFIQSELKSMENDNEIDIHRKVTEVFTESLARKLNSAKDSAKKDALVMHKLKKRMSSSKDDFFVVNLRIGDGTSDTEDGDGTIQNDFMKTRLSYLSLCQLKNYQFDTLRRAKHTTMMTLYHIHMKPTLDQKLCQNSSGAECNTKIESIEQQRSLLKNKKILDVLTHANSCRATIDKPCSYPYCSSVKSLFFHSRKCKIHVAGGCESCKKIWSLIKLHCQHCDETDCKFPRCGEMKSDR